MKSKYVHTKHTRNELARLAMGTIFLVKEESQRNNPAVGNSGVVDSLHLS